MARTDDDLRRLLHDLESDQVERKETLSTEGVRDRVRQAICAFANDLPGYATSGVVFIGVTDSGRVLGVDLPEQVLLTLSDMRSQGRILPPPTMYVRRLDTPDGQVAVVEVEPSWTPPVRCDGQVWIRVGPRRALATAEEERRLAERRRAQDLPFDSRRVLGATLDDLDLSLFERDYLPAVLTPEVLAANGRDVNQRLTSLRLATVDETPTAAGVLILGREPTAYLPGAYVQFLRVDGPDLSCPVVDEKRFDTALPIQLAAIDDYLKLNVRTAVEIGTTLRDRRSSDYPLAAIRPVAIYGPADHQEVFRGGSRGHRPGIQAWPVQSVPTGADLGRAPGPGAAPRPLGPLPCWAVRT
jgi:ATP-dependent DNA helicase RecG